LSITSSKGRRTYPTQDLLIVRQVRLAATTAKDSDPVQIDVV
jgi:hypothetical protein